MRSLFILLQCLCLSLAALKSQLALAGLMKKPSAEPVLRTEGGMSYLALSPNRRYLAFTNALGLSLRILDLSTQEIVEVTEHKTGPGFFWSPDGARLFYRILSRKGDQVQSDVLAYDCELNRSLAIESFAGSSGFPLFDPWKQSLSLLHEQGIMQKRLEFPGQRRAQWQKEKRVGQGSWIVSQSGVLWLGDLGLSLMKMPDDNSGLSSYAVSPDSRRIAWATRAGKIYTALDGGEVRYLAEGLDPSWHPHRSLLVFAGARKIGAKVTGHELMVSDLKSHVRELTKTPSLDERFPVWLDPQTIVYTAAGTTDLFKLEFTDLGPIANKTAEQKRL